MGSMLNREWRGASMSVATDSRGVGFPAPQTKPFKERKENNMIIARAAKGAALLLMIFGVVALIGCPAASPGATGKPGPAGAQGEPGAKGEPGTPGPAALGTIGEPTDPHVIYINNAGTLADPVIGDVKDPKGGVDVTALFAGGVSPITYRITVEPANASLFKATINDDKQIVVTKRTATETDPSGAYEADGTALTALTVRATDNDGRTATKLVHIRTNKAPTLAGSGWNPIVVGTQSEKYSDTYKAMNVASADFNLGANYLFEDLGSGNNQAAIDGRKAITYTISSTKRGTGTGTEYATAAIEGSVLTVTGLKSTWDKDATPPAHVPIDVKVKATDAGGMFLEQVVQIVVDGAPELGDTAPPAVVSKKATGTQGIVVRNLNTYFEDPEGTTAPITIVGATIAPTQLGEVDIDSNNLRLTPNNQGAATITFYASSSGVPLVAQAANYLANVYVDRDGDGTVEGGSASTLTQVLKHEIKVTITP